MLDKLQNLLDQQLELAHRGIFTGPKIKVLGQKADCLVEIITQAGILEKPEFEKQKNKLEKSYQNLCLAITAQRADTADKLSRIRRGRKIIETYRAND